MKVDYNKFVELKTKELDISSKTLDHKLLKVKTNDDLTNLIAEYTEETYKNGLETLKKYFDNSTWNDPIAQYVYINYLSPNLPKYLYYDEYYSLPSKISIEELQKDNLEEEELKTAKALFELADIDIDTAKVKAENLNIKKLLNKKSSNLSSGEQQKVEIIRALASGKKILILDEPFAFQDKVNLDKLIEAIEEYRKITDGVVIFSTHSADAKEYFSIQKTIDI